MTGLRFCTVLILGLTISSSMARIVGKCDLVRELRNHGINDDWRLRSYVCIAKHESSFNTQAQNNINTDGSHDFGLFQINDRYWCSPPGTGCNVKCTDLLNDDISDDIECAKHIENAQGLGAWVAYNTYCANNNDVDINGC